MKSLRKIYIPIIITLVNLIISLTAISQTPDTAFFPSFQAYSSSPIIKYGDGFADAAWNDPTVLKVNGQYVMYISAAQGITGANKVKIFRMVSGDGYSWSLSPQTPVLEPVPGTYYAGGTETPSVVFFQGKYNMYIIAYPVTAQNAYDFTIGHAVSTDGISWQIDANPILESDGSATWMGQVVGEPGALVYHDSLYLFFAGGGVENGNTVESIGLIRSADGTNFGTAIEAVKLPQDVYPSSDGWYGLSTPSALAINDSIYLFTDVAKIINGKWTQVALHQFKTYGNMNHWYHGNSPIYTTADFSWTNGNYISEIRSITPFMDDNGKLKIYYAGNHIGDISGTDTTYHVTVDSLGLHVDPNFWGIGTSEYQFPAVTTGIDSKGYSATSLMYPNPANEYIIITSSKNEEWNIINSIGEIVIRKQKTNTRINVSYLSNGIYYLVSPNSIYNQQFIINR
jgi:hypothetical protein